MRSPSCIQADAAKCVQATQTVSAGLYRYSYFIISIPLRMVVAIGDWMERKHIEYWKSGKDRMHSKALMEGPRQGRAKHEQAATIRFYWSAHRTSWPKGSFI